MKKINPGDPETRSADLVADNIERLKELFPEAFQEGRIDFDVLKQLLGGAVDEREERYGLNWNGKRQARQIALTPSLGTLRPCPDESVDWDTTKNLMIEGDNLEVLKLLQKSYSGRIKLIYIDPPYNTGKDFIYPDSFQNGLQNYLELTSQTDGEGRKTSSNTETSGRFHTNWLNMMYPRLKLARQLLRSDGAILCSIDDAEVSRLRVVFDEVFGEENFLAQFAWRTDGNFDNQAKVKICHEYVLLYAKSIDEFPHPPVVDPSVPPGSKIFRPEIRNTVVKNGPKNPESSIRLPQGFPADFDEGVIPATSSSWPKHEDALVVKERKLLRSVEIRSGWSSKELLLEFIAAGCKTIRDGKEQETQFVLTRTGAVEAIKTRSDTQSHVISVLNGFGGAQKASAQLAELGAFFNGYPKPVELVRYLVQMAYGNDGVFLDFFAGSGPLAQAVLEQNAADSGTRRYILVQLPEPLDPLSETTKEAVKYCDGLGLPRNIAELTKQRILRVSKRIRAANLLFVADAGFRVFKLASSNVRVWNPDREDLQQSLLDHTEHLVSGRTEQDLLFEALLKLGLDLSERIETRVIDGCAVHSVGAGALMLCFADGLTRESVEPLARGILEWRAALAPAVATQFVFKDSGFVDDVAKTNLVAILEQSLDDTQRAPIRSL